MSQDNTPFEPAPPAGGLFFWLALLIVSIAAIFYNYTLIADPMSKLVGGRAVIFGLGIASVAAGIIVTLEIFTGLFFLESRGVTHLFPVIHALPAAARQWLGYGFVLLLINFASIQAGLVWMARVLAEQAGAEPHASMDQISPATGMAIAFVLPLVLILAGLSLDRVARTLRGQPV